MRRQKTEILKKISLRVKENLRIVLYSILRKIVDQVRNTSGEKNKTWINLANTLKLFVSSSGGCQMDASNSLSISLSSPCNYKL